MVNAVRLLRAAALATLSRLLFVLLGFALLPAAYAQVYPSQPIRLIVGFTPGTGIDIIARTVGQKLSERVGQPVIIENKPGASGNIGTDIVAKAKPDGYTLLVTVSTFAVVPALYKSLPFDPAKDFAPIS